jgi:anti-sigma B factor antagonist
MSLERDIRSDDAIAAVPGPEEIVVHAGQATLCARSDDTVYCIVLLGEVDLSCAAELRGLLGWAADTDVASIVVDLSGLDFIDSRGVATLVEAYDQCGSRLALLRGPRRVHRVFELMALDRLLPFAQE